MSAGDESALPCSRSALDKLGQRLADDGEPSDSDRALLRSVLAAYDVVLAESEERVRHIVAGFSSGGPTLGIATRVKTTGTIREKLRRQAGMGLKGMQDIAGIRIAGDLSRGQQNELGAALLNEFSGTTRPPRLSDRRVEPSHGYRALHVIVVVHDLPVEIQIRTAGQDAWAQLIEKLGDVWGRGIRYGEPPPHPTKSALGELTREGLLRSLMQFSDALEADSVAGLEDEAFGDQLADLERRLQQDPDELGPDVDSKAMLEEVDDMKARVLQRTQERSERQDELRKLLNSLADASGGWS